MQMVNGESDNGMFFRDKRKKYRAMKKTWKKLTCIILSERSQSENVTI